MEPIEAPDSYHICAAVGWFEREMAFMMTPIAPEHAASWLHLSYAARRSAGGGIRSAWEVPLSLADKFPSVPMIPYNLACYVCQLGYLESARIFLTKAFSTGEAAEFKTQAILTCNHYG